MNSRLTSPPKSPIAVTSSCGWSTVRVRVRVLDREGREMIVRLLRVQPAALLTVIKDSTEAVLEGPADIASRTVDGEVPLQGVDDRQQVVLVPQHQRDHRLLLQDLEHGV